MISIFNRRKLLSTFSSDTQEAVRRALKRSRIHYRCRIRNLTAAVGSTHSGGHRIAPFHLEGSMQYEYLFSVHRRDLDDAIGALAREGIHLQ